MTSRTAWIAGSTLVLVSVGVSIFSIFTAAHKEALNRRLEEQRLKLTQENREQNGLTPPFGTSTTFIDENRHAYRIIDGRVYFTPPIAGLKAPSKHGFTRSYGAEASRITDTRLLHFMAHEILHFRHVYGPFLYDIESVELRHWGGQPCCSKLHGAYGEYRIVLDRSIYGGATIRSIAHEVTHLASPFLFSWYMEGLADLRADEALRSSGFDKSGSLALQVHRHSPHYTAALSLMHQLDLIVGRMELISLVKQTKETDWVGIKPQKGDDWAKPLHIDIEAWLATLDEQDRRACVDVIQREGRKLKIIGNNVHPQLDIYLPK